MTLNPNDLKMDIINIISQINDPDKLVRIYEKISNVSKERSNIKEAIVELTEGLTYDEVLKEQNYKHSNYKEFRESADKIQWKHSLDELLKVLD